MDISKLTIPELKKLSEDVKRELVGREKQNLDDARAKILKIAQDVGVSLDSLLSVKSIKPVTKVAAQYRDPANPELEWTGRGRQPKWLVKALGEGKQIQDFKIA